jgi:hypothetical protein
VDEQKQMPIHRAVYHGWPVLVKLLIDAGSPLTAQDKVASEFYFSRTLSKRHLSCSGRANGMRLVVASALARK